MAIGVSEYMALKNASNPHERNVKGIGTMMALNANKPDPYGIQGLANLPLSYAMGKETAAANNYDAETVQGVKGYIDQKMQMDKDEAAQKAKGEAMKNWLELGKFDPNAANQLAAQDPILQTTLPSGIRLTDKINKDGWITGEALSDDGKTKTVYQFNLGGIPEATAKLKTMGITGTPTADQLAEAMPPGFAFKLSGASKPAGEQTDKPQSQVVQDKTSPTGWSYVTEQANLIQGAPDPTKAKERIVDEGANSDRQDRRFESWIGKYQSLQGRIASIRKGYDPMLATVIAPENIDRAIAGLTPDLDNTKAYIQKNFPSQWRDYAGTQATATTVVEPMTATNPQTGQKIISYDGGKSWRPR